MYNYSTNRLTWHEGIIPEDEIWIKLGGDKGGDTMKVSFQVVNVPTPNSVKNTVVFSIFVGLDTRTNLHIALDRYREQVQTLQETEWRYNYIMSCICNCTCTYFTSKHNFRGKKVRVFFSGDYEFLCRIYGITGAQGCLICGFVSTHLPVVIVLMSTHRSSSMPVVHYYIT